MTVSMVEYEAGCGAIGAGHQLDKRKRLLFSSGKSMGPIKA
jgi:hypothetical protein